MKLLHNKFIKWGVIPFLFLGLWAILSLSYINNSSGLTLLIYGQHRNNFSNWMDGELLKGQKVDAEFTSPANNLGIVAVRFNTYERINNDQLIFRMREKGQKIWPYENVYKVDQFQPNQVFTFGFPVIENSEGKTYQFELESTKGKHLDAVALSPIEPVFVTKHEYPKHTIIADSQKRNEFLHKKAQLLISDPEFLITSLLYLLPIVFYFIWQLDFGGHISASRTTIQKKVSFSKFLKSVIMETDGVNSSIRKIISIAVIFILFDVFFVGQVSQIVIVLLTAIWIFILVKAKLESKMSFIIAFFFLALCPLLLIINLEKIAEKSAVWAYVFLFIGVVQQMIEVRADKKGVKS